MGDPLARFGITLPGTDVRRHMETARYCDRAGVDSIWVIETRLTTDAVAPMAAYASATDRIRIGSGVIPMWTRNPALIAQTFATLDLLAPGRIVLGLGAWWDPLAGRAGVRREKPLRAMREVVESARLLFSMKEPVTYRGQYVHMDRLYLDHGGSDPHEVKIYVAAVGPQMLRLAGRIADGVVLNSNHTVGAVRSAVEQIGRGAESAGRSLADIERVEPIRLRVTRDKKQALKDAKPRLAMYLAQQPHIEGPTEVDPELAGRVKAVIPWPATEQQVMDGARLIPDELVDSLGCYGDEDEVRERLTEYIAAGVTLPTVSGESRETIDFMAGIKPR
jgi:5,10-methylenetetrahydromethanopterin reductase